MPFTPGGDHELPPEEQILVSEIIQGLASSPDSTGPEASSDEAPLSEGTTPGETPEGDDDLGPVEFDERAKLDFEGLLYLGALDHEFTWAGHRFKIRTLTTGELLEVALAQRRYRDTLGDSRSYVTAIVAACLVHVDRKPLPRPISNVPTDSEFANRFDYVKDHWMTWTVDAIYEQYLVLEERVQKAIDAMGKASPSVASMAG